MRAGGAVSDDNSSFDAPASKRSRIAGPPAPAPQVRCWGAAAMAGQPPAGALGGGRRPPARPPRSPSMTDFCCARAGGWRRGGAGRPGTWRRQQWQPPHAPRHGRWVAGPVPGLGRPAAGVAGGLPHPPHRGAPGGVGAARLTPLGAARGPLLRPGPLRGLRKDDEAAGAAASHLLDLASPAACSSDRPGGQPRWRARAADRQWQRQRQVHAQRPRWRPLQCRLVPGQVRAFSGGHAAQHPAHPGGGQTCCWGQRSCGGGGGGGGRAQTGGWGGARTAHDVHGDRLRACRGLPCSRPALLNAPCAAATAPPTARQAFTVR